MARTYVLLQRDQNGLWSQVGAVESSSASSAVRTATEGLGDGETSTFVAIPERSWDPIEVSVEVQTQRRTKLSSSKPKAERKPRAAAAPAAPAAVAADAA
jgi:hypothetical protein